MNVLYVIHAVGSLIKNYELLMMRKLDYQENLHHQEALRI